mmetsp:Transcript_3614/g.7494  ORF Transcript_3614/g.7494 Transcript_3614/m.7494 type:complete len:86 (-) Transcript_3614:114-371(-)
MGQASHQRKCEKISSHSITTGSVELEEVLSQFGGLTRSCVFPHLRTNSIDVETPTRRQAKSNPRYRGALLIVKSPAFQPWINRTP